MRPLHGAGGGLRSRRSGEGGARALLPNDPQHLLAQAVRRLVEGGACERAIAWTRRADGAPYVAAAAFEGEPPVSPRAEEFASAAALAGAATLGGPEAPDLLRALGERHGCAAAAPIRVEGGEAVAVLLLGASVRPRTLAALDAAAARLSGPLAAALALERLRRLDAEVRELDRLAALGRLAGEIVHEVRNPLVSIKTFLQLLPERRGDAELLDEFLALANSELRRMERLLDRVFDQARPPSEEAGASAAPASVLAATAELLRHHAAARGVRLEVDCGADAPEAAAPEDALRQVLLNLALNAVDATPSGGTVRLRARRALPGLEISVSDEGPGIAPELRGAVFEPFFSTRSDRSGGLGLAIARRLVEQAGGAIEIGDGEPRGAEFRVRLPAAAAERSDSDPTASRPAGGGPARSEPQASGDREGVTASRPAGGGPARSEPQASGDRSG
jgi:signal transduction histidine kinase